MRAGLNRVDGRAVASTMQPRGADRRIGFDLIAGALGRAVARGSALSLRETLAEALQKVLRARGVHLRRLGGPIAREQSRERLISFEIPVREHQPRTVLQCVFDEQVRLGEWEVQVVRIAAQMAALVMELDRHRLIVSTVIPGFNRWSGEVDGQPFARQVAGDVRTDNSATLLELVRQGAGIGRLTTLAAGPLARRGELVRVLPGTFVTPPVPMYAMMLQERQRLPKIRACIDYWAQWMAEQADADARA